VSITPIDASSLPLNNLSRKSGSEGVIVFDMLVSVYTILDSEGSLLLLSQSPNLFLKLLEYT
jgi:hypothetical protein